jgi:hypothetical protein
MMAGRSGELDASSSELVAGEPFSPLNGTRFPGWLMLERESAGGAWRNPAGDDSEKKINWKILVYVQDGAKLNVDNQKPGWKSR